MLRRTPYHLHAFTALATVFAAYAVPASAQSIPDLDISGQLGIASEFVGKGIGKSNGEISPFGSIELGASDVYASVVVAGAELSQGADLEILSTIGYRPKIGSVSFDLAILNRDLYGSRTDYQGNSFEYQVDASQKFGPVNVRLRLNYTPDGFGATEGAWWNELQTTLSLDAKTKLSAAIGDRSADGGASYAAWNIGAKRKLTDSVTLDLRYYDTDSRQISDAYDSRLVASVSFAF